MLLDDLLTQVWEQASQFRACYLLTTLPNRVPPYGAGNGFRKIRPRKIGPRKIGLVWGRIVGDELSEDELSGDEFS